jgi:hypothetical protein
VKQGFKGTILSINGVYFLRNYGTFTYAVILAHVMAYAFRSGREEQDATSLLNCLEDTLTTSALDIINAERAKYTLTRAQVNAHLAASQLPLLAGNPDDEYQDGVLFLWCILNRTAPQTNATITTIIRQLNRLNNIMEEAKSDILAFNTKVRLLLNQYVANTGQEYDRAILITALFEAYKIPTNQEFINFIVRTEQDHNFNTKIVTADELMESSLKLYQNKTVDGSWDKLTSDQKQAINLMAQFNSFKTKMNPSRVQGAAKSNQSQGNQQQPNEDSMKKKYLSAPDWKKKKPSDVNAPYIKDGKTYYWCNKHEMFTMHKAAECNLSKCYRFYKQTQDDKNNNNTDNRSNNNSKNGGKKKNNRSNNNSSKLSEEKSGENNRLQYSGGQGNMAVDAEYEDY